MNFFESKNIKIPYKATIKVNFYLKTKKRRTGLIKRKSKQNFL